MDQRPHPEHERLVRRRTTAGWWLFLPFLAVLAADPFPPWGKWVGVAGLLAAAGVFVSASARVDRCRCPTCGRALRRRSDETPFACGPCGVAWTTSGYGGSTWGA